MIGLIALPAVFGALGWAFGLSTAGFIVTVVIGALLGLVWWVFTHGNGAERRRTEADHRQHHGTGHTDESDAMPLVPAIASEPSGGGEAVPARENCTVSETTSADTGSSSSCSGGGGGDSGGGGGSSD